MPAQFTVKASDLKVLLSELRKVDPNLRKELQNEMKSDLAPVVTRLASGIPRPSPLSGFSPRAVSGSRRSSRSNAGVSRYRWTSVSGKVKTPLGKRAKVAGFHPVVSMSFRSKGKAAGFEILELAGSKTSGSTPQGRGLIRALNAVAPIKDGLGRFVIPQGKKESGETVAIARRIIEKYVEKVNRRIR